MATSLAAQTSADRSGGVARGRELAARRPSRVTLTGLVPGSSLNFAAKAAAGFLEASVPTVAGSFSYLGLNVASDDPADQRRVCVFIKNTRRPLTPVHKHLLTFYALCRRFHHSARHSLYLALSCNLGSTWSSQAVTSW